MGKSVRGAHSPQQCLNPKEEGQENGTSSITVANPPPSYRGLSGPKSPKNLKQVSRGLRPWGPKKPRSPEQRFSRLFPDVSDFFETFSIFWAQGPEAPGDFSQTFWGSRALRARETPVTRGRVRNITTTNLVKEKSGSGGGSADFIFMGAGGFFLD